MAQQIALENVSKRFGSTVVFDGFSMRFPPRRVVCLTGPSGCGKTTLLRLLAGLETPDAGRVLLPDGLRTAFVFQEDRLLPWRSALENVMLVGCTAERAMTLLAALGLTDAAGKRPGELSGGMCRRVAIARAVAAGGGLLLLDEPFKGLDDAARDTAMDFLRRAFADAATVYVTHDLAEAGRFADEVRRLAPV